MKSYLPFIIGGGVLVVVFLLLKGGGGGGQQSVAPVVPPRFSSIGAGPTDYTYDLARLQMDFARTQLTAGLFSTLLQRDFALKQLTFEQTNRQAELALQNKALELDYQRSLQEQFLNTKSMGGF